MSYYTNITQCMYVSLSDRLYMSFTACIISRSCTLSETYSRTEKLRSMPKGYGNQILLTEKIRSK